MLTGIGYFIMVLLTAYIALVNIVQSASFDKELYADIKPLAF